MNDKSGGNTYTSMLWYPGEIRLEIKIVRSLLRITAKWEQAKNTIKNNESSNAYVCSQAKILKSNTFISLDTKTYHTLLFDLCYKRWRRFFLMAQVDRAYKTQ